MADQPTILIDLQREETRIAKAVAEGQELDLARELANTVMPLLSQVAQVGASTDAQIIAALEKVVEDFTEEVDDEDDDFDDELVDDENAGLRQSVINVLEFGVRVCAPMIDNEIMKKAIPEYDDANFKEFVQDAQTLITALHEIAEDDEENAREEKNEG